LRGGPAGGLSAARRGPGQPGRARAGGRRSSWRRAL